MTSFVDTNVMVDLLLRRKPFVDDAMRIFYLAEVKRITAVVSPLSFATTSYLLERYAKCDPAKILREFQSLVSIASIDEELTRKSIAQSSPIPDPEDAMQYYSALHAGYECIVTRNQMDFHPSSLPVYSPREFLEYCA